MEDAEKKTYLSELLATRKQQMCDKCDEWKAATGQDRNAKRVAYGDLKIDCNRICFMLHRMS